MNSVQRRDRENYRVPQSNVCAYYHNVGCHAQDHSLAGLILVHKRVVISPAVVTAVVDSTDNIHRLE
jgi:hypothetical protein